MLRDPLTYQLQLLYDTTHWCGATLITSRHAISAAHCFSWNEFGPRDLSKYKVRSGVLYNDGGDKETRSIKGIEKPFQGAWLWFKPDLVILKLRRPFNLVEGLVQPACLPSKAVKHGDTCFTSGWGQTSFPEKTPSINLKVAKMKIKDRPWDCDNGNYLYELNF